MSERIQISTPLTLFTSFDVIKRLDPHLLVRFLDLHKDYLTPEAAALLAKNGDSGYMDFYSDWAAQFQNADAFGAPLLHALMAIEALAAPDNLPLLNNAASALPHGWLLNHQAQPLHRALSLWLVSKGITGVRFPVIPGLPVIRGVRIAYFQRLAPLPGGCSSNQNPLPPPVKSLFFFVPFGSLSLWCV